MLEEIGETWEEETAEVTSSCLRLPDRRSCHTISQAVSQLEEVDLVIEVVGFDCWERYLRWVRGAKLQAVPILLNEIEFVNLTIFQVAPVVYFFARVAQDVPPIPREDSLIELYFSRSVPLNIESRLKEIWEYRQAKKKRKGVKAEVPVTENPPTAVIPIGGAVKNNQKAWILRHLLDCPECWEELLNGLVPSHLRCRHTSKSNKRCRHYAMDGRGFCEQHQPPVEVPEEERCVAKPGGHSCKRRRKPGFEYCPECAKRRTVLEQRRQDRLKSKREKQARLKTEREAEKLRIRQVQEAKRCVHVDRGGRCRQDKIQGSDYCQKHHDLLEAKRQSEIMKLWREANRENRRRDRETAREVERRKRFANRAILGAKLKKQKAEEEAQRQAKRCVYTAGNGRCRQDKIQGSDYCQKHLPREVEVVEGECTYVYPLNGKKCRCDATSPGYCTMHKRYAQDVPARNDAERCVGKRTKGRCSKKAQVDGLCFGCHAKRKE